VLYKNRNDLKNPEIMCSYREILYDGIKINTTLSKFHILLVVIFQIFLTMLMVCLNQYGLAQILLFFMLNIGMTIYTLLIRPYDNYFDLVCHITGYLLNVINCGIYIKLQDQKINNLIYEKYGDAIMYLLTISAVFISIVQLSKTLYEIYKNYTESLEKISDISKQQLEDLNYDNKIDLSKSGVQCDNTRNQNLPDQPTTTLVGLNKNN